MKDNMLYILNRLFKGQASEVPVLIAISPCTYCHKSLYLLAQVPALFSDKARRCRNALLMLLLVVLGVTGAQAQDYSGTYFIASKSTRVNGTANQYTYDPDPAYHSNNYYLCPTEGWYFYNGDNTAADNSCTVVDNGRPFLTTYRCKNGIYDATKAIWIIEKAPAPNSDYYYIKQNKTTDSGYYRYIVSNRQIDGASNKNRMRVHLEEVADAATLTTLGDLALFEITEAGGHLYIKPHSEYGQGDDDGKGNVCDYLVVNNGNSNNLVAGNTKTDGPNVGGKGRATGGIISVYSIEENAYWHLEDAHCATPVLSFDNLTGEVTMTCATSGATIYYTDDDTTPTTSSTAYNPASKPTVSAATTIKAIAVETTKHVNSEVATLEITQVATPTIQNNGSNAISITCATEGATIYYTLDGSAEPNLVYNPATPLREGYSNQSIRAIAKKPNCITSAVVSGSVKLTCEPPIISQDEGKTFVLASAFPTAGVTLKYSINSDSGPFTDYPGTPVSFSNYGDIVYAKATAGTDYFDSSVASQEMVEDLQGSGTPEDPYLIRNNGDVAMFVKKVNETVDGASKYYKLKKSVSGSSALEITVPFTGTLEGEVDPDADDGTYCKISGLSHALFNTISGGTVKNIVLDGVSVSGSGNVGAIANVVEGTEDHVASIYNCGVLSGTVTGTNYVGSIVGLLGSTSDANNSYARVINCYSFATVSGSTVGGIAGYNSYASKSGDIRTMVMNCMFYGTGTGIYPIYGGLKICNEGNISDATEKDSRLNNYNYFSFEKLPTANIAGYNNALAAEDRYLKRFEFYRYILNSTRELAAWYATGSTADAHTKMAKWVLDKAIAEYPILKIQDSNETGTYPSVVNYDPDYTFVNGVKTSRSSLSDPNKGRDLGTTLTVSISVGTGAPTGASINPGKSSLTLKRTDKDFENYNFNYDKVQLPYYNEVGTGNCTENKVVTGWKITGMTGGVEDTYNPSDTWDGYNFADRAHYAKDIYGTSGRVFSQGAYFDVPDGVSAITIEPYWGNAAYLSDATYDCYGDYFSDKLIPPSGRIVPNGVTDFGTRYEDGNSYDICGNSQPVYTSFSTALASLSGGTVYDNAIVLVGNYHQGGPPATGTSKSFTIMSADMNNDNEPDYCFIFNTGKNEEFSPVRFDFVAVPGTSMAHKITSTTFMGIMGNHKWNGWLETTNTSLIRFSQLEYDSEKKKGKSPLILLGGIVEQMVSTNGTDAATTVTHTSYIHVGSNVWFKMFDNGCHMDRIKVTTPRIPISVTGGEYEKFYLSGFFQPNAPTTGTGDAECYISGGRFGEVAGAGQEQIDGNVQWLIDRADIEAFFGGGINPNKPITGDIIVTIKNSTVDQYCGGPKFGNMGADKTVTTSASNCTFGTYYGAGYGGTALVRQVSFNKYDKVNYDWVNTNISGAPPTGGSTLCSFLNGNNKRGNYDPVKGGISVSYEYEHFEGSNDKTVARFYVNYASLSLAETGNVTSTLTGCTVNGDFFGGGKLGRVKGHVTSTLTDCTVNGSVYGAGFSGAATTADVFPAQGFTNSTPGHPRPNYNTSTGVFEAGEYPVAVQYTWSNTKGGTSNTLVDEGDNHYIYVDPSVVNLNELGTVTGEVVLNIDGTTTVAHNVYGGGAASDVTGEDVGSGNDNVVVNIKSGTVAEDVFGGGEGATTVVDGNIVVNMGTKTTAEPPVISGSAAVRDIYGGSALGSVNAYKEAGVVTFHSDKTTKVNLFKGTVNRNVYGGGLGNAEHPAYVGGDVTVELNNGTYTKDDTPNADKGCVVKGSIFGANNVNGTPKRHVTVHIYKTQHKDKTAINDKFALPYENDTQYDLLAVYGGGNEADYVPTDATQSTEVVIEGCDLTSIKDVYGGGNAAAVPASEVWILGTKMIDNVFGGGNGELGADHAAHVGYHRISSEEKTNYASGTGKALTKLVAGTIHNVYGGSNSNGDIRSGAEITMPQISEYIASHSTLPAPSYCSDLVTDNIYGGGKNADMSSGTSIVLGCMPDDVIDEIYAGAQNADVAGDVELTITSGKFARVFGGNKDGGMLNGSITVNIEETGEGCGVPIIIGELYGGGNLAGYSVYGYKNTADPGDPPVWEPRVSDTDDGTGPATPYADPQLNVRAFTSIGKIFGGGYSALMVANPHVDINVVKGSHYNDDPIAAGTLGTYPYPAHAKGKIGAISNVFGGGNLATVIGNATVNIGTEEYIYFIKEPTHLGAKGTAYTEESDGTFKVRVEGADILDNIYGGGNLADVEGNTQVNICAKEVEVDDVMVWQTVAEGSAGVSIAGDVFGAGKGADDNVETALVKGGSNVYMGGGWAKKSIYGGGELASVGDFNYTDGKPSSLKTPGTGTALVNVFGGKVGPAVLEMPNFTGHVFGAGKGKTGSVALYEKLNFVNATNVTIGGTAFVKGSVYGGSENGHVLGNTDVTISGGQIGCGYNESLPAAERDLDRVYTTEEWAYDVTANPAQFLYECNHWPYGIDTDSNGEKDLYAPYDEFANTDGSYPGGSALPSSEGGRPASHASDGHTFYGNVFGGGSGAFPYAAGQWLWTAGAVEGNTHVTITGGHILTSVYGGNELTNVGGTCTVEMTGGTLGVPRTLDQIQNHPVTCYLFGAGKGDQRVLFNQQTNVKDVVVNVEGGTIYGSVFGGGEDGHVQRDVQITIGKNDGTGPAIGTWGTSYVEGNIFGGGRGFGADAYTAGNVAGSIDIDIKGGTMLGSIYGGGRLGSVGYGLFPATGEGSEKYGVMQDDDKLDDGTTSDFYTTGPNGLGRGHIDISISGGTIGNTWEYVYNPDASTKAKMPGTGFDADNHLTHSRGGNVFTGGMGRQTKLNGDFIGAGWEKYGNVKSTKLTISGGTIKSNVYGGAELGAVTGSHTTDEKPYGTEITITGGTIGTVIGEGVNKYTFGSVYGSGMGNEDHFTSTIRSLGGVVESNTKIDMSGGIVRASVYGGGEVAGVTGNTNVTISGGSIGDADIKKGGATIGNVYGGGKGSTTCVIAGLVKGDANVNVNGGTIYHNIYGGGAYGSLGTYEHTDYVITSHTSGGTANVTVAGGIIGIDGDENGLVFGAPRGDVGAPGSVHDKLAWVYDTNVTIGATDGTGPTVNGSVYGSGENGHTYNDAAVTIHGGTIGIHDGTAADATRGNVYGAGCGTDKYWIDDDSDGVVDDGEEHYNPLAGIVYGNTAVTIDGGTVMRNVYGAGAMGSVGNTAAGTGGKTEINISSGTIGYDGADNGNVFGAARGEVGVSTLASGLAQVRETEVNVKKPAATKSVAIIQNDVFGGGQAGIVREDVAVNISGGEIANDVYGGGALAYTNTSNWNFSNDTWVSDKNTGGITTYKTSVVLTGGLMGNAYGGGLGDATTEANVYGDVAVSVNEPTKKSSTGGVGAAFRENSESYISYLDKDNNPVNVPGSALTTGRVFGCNNFKGTPKGHVTVDVYETRHRNDAEGGHHNLGEYEIQGVYGGGNQADYAPATPYSALNPTGKKTQVNIHGCDKTSIYEVYGGGNAADVPATDVNIYGTFEIDYAFGGGNGREKVKLVNGTWKENQGANVTGQASVTLYGGTVHDVFGGSNSKGDCGSTLVRQETPDPSDPDKDCTLKITNLYGAGNEATGGDVYIILGACSAKPSVDGVTADYSIRNIIGGSRKADINGGITMTVTSGDLDNVFGGNYLGGRIFGPIEVNIEETDCQPLRIKNLYGAGRNADYPSSNPAVDVYDESFTKGSVTVNVKSCTSIGTIYGGGYDSNVHGDVQVNINLTKGKWAGQTYLTEEIPDHIGTIGKVYGGGYKGYVFGDTEVNIGTETTVQLVKHDNDGNPLDSSDAVVDITTPGALPGALAYIAYDTKTVLGANITGKVFGGGEEANVTGNTAVNIGTADIKGAATDAGLAAQYEGIKIGGSVYGGGYKGSVGTFKVGDADYSGTARPTSCTSGTGTCTVTISGDAVIGHTDMVMPTFSGNVFGGGEGEVKDTTHVENANLQYMTFVNKTDVTVKHLYKAGHEGDASYIISSPLVCGSVYGGSESGHVLGYDASPTAYATNVKIKGGQIGVGAGETAAYSESQWTAAKTAVEEGDAAGIIAAALRECAHWPYGIDDVYAPYDPNASTEVGHEEEYPDAAHTSTAGGRRAASDGHTYYGNVFGGGSGVFPFVKNPDGQGKGQSKWLASAGVVYGNTKVEIDGGHVLTCVYGGNEMTDVEGKCTVTMKSGTIGVPRTLEQIKNHPVTCYLYGAGKGDERVFFNQWTNVNSVEVNVTGGIIFGSVFGGGEDGHVLGDVDVNVTNGTIGTWGTSYVDGNIFGGGRGFAGDALTAGVVSGNVDVDIDGGTILGSVYGGGRLASVGTHLAREENTALYGKMIDDGTEQRIDRKSGNVAVETVPGRKHGHITIDISGGTIGNNFEFIVPSGTGSDSGNDIAAGWNDEDWKSWKEANYIPNTEFGTSGTDNKRLMRTMGGNVFAGCMGRIYELDGTVIPHWPDFAKAKTTKVTISGTAVIKSNVYGGGELGMLIPTDPLTSTTGHEVGSEIIIRGGTIGSEVVGGDQDYTFGSVYGGGYGSEEVVEGTLTQQSSVTTVARDRSGVILGNTEINMSGSSARVWASVYGGGELAQVSGNTYVNVSDGEIGKGVLQASGYVKYGGYRMGNVYGAGKGSLYFNAGQVKGDTYVTISGGNVYHNVYGGGALASVGDYVLYTDKLGANPVPDYLEEYASVGSPMACTAGGTATVTITAGTIGINGWDNGMVNGSGRGEVSTPVGTPAFDTYDRLAWVNKSVVTIGNVGSEAVFVAPQPQIKGSVYGGGENGHNFGDAEINIISGTIGTDASASYDNANVYGAGCGTDKYWIDTDADGVEDAGETHHNRSAGYVQGGSSVNIQGGEVKGSVYGGGSMASVSVKANINVSGGLVDGSVYGGPKGDFSDTELKAHAKATDVTISGSAIVNGSVFGGGEYGIVEEGVTVKMTGGTVATNLYGGGAMADTNTANVTGGGGYKDNEDNSSKAIASTATHTTLVRLTGGTIGGISGGGDAYGGALGRREVKTGAVVTTTAIAPKVYGNILLDLNGTTVSDTEGTDVVSGHGCVLKRIFGCNDLEGTPKGHVKVHVYATQRPGGTDTSDKYAKFDNLTTYTASNYSGLNTLATAVGISTSTGSYKDYTDVLADGSATAEAKAEALANMIDLISDKKYDVLAVYGGGDLAMYEPVDAFLDFDPDATDEENLAKRARFEKARPEVRIYGCDLTSIKQVYGGGNAAPAPATYVRVNSAYEIGELFGGGNGKDNYSIQEGSPATDVWYENPGANVGYVKLADYDKTKTVAANGTGTEGDPFKAIVFTDPDATTKEGRQANYPYGAGEATTEVVGGRVHYAYGGSNEKGNIRSVAMSSYQEASSSCPLLVDKIYGAGKNAEIDGSVMLKMDCVDYMAKTFGGSTAADVNSDINLWITNGTYQEVYGGNDTSGKIYGSIKVYVQEQGCKPIRIGKLFGGGYKADYSIYGYNDNGTARTKAQFETELAKLGENPTNDALIAAGLYGYPKDDPYVNVISATWIGDIYGGGNDALVVGSPHINVNMQKGQVLSKYVTGNSEYTVGPHERTDELGTYTLVVEDIISEEGITKDNAELAIGKIGNIYGGGNDDDVDGDTRIDIGTGSWKNESGVVESIERNAATITNNVYGGGNHGDVTGNTLVNMANGTVANRIYGGGSVGHVGTITKDASGKPDTWASGTGESRVTISGGTVGPDGYPKMDPTDPTWDMGYVFGAGKGDDPSADASIDNEAYVYDSYVTVSGTAFIKGSVYGGSENGHVRNDTYVTIEGGQIGCGAGKTSAYSSDLWTAAQTAVELANSAKTDAEITAAAAAIASAAGNMPECHSWPFGVDTSVPADGKADRFAPYDPNADADGEYADDSDAYAWPTGSDGHTFYGNVFGGGSGYYPYVDGDGKSQWVKNAGRVEGNSNVTITGGHILTSVYGGCEMSDVEGKSTVTMSGGTLGVPRTLTQIKNHPVTCYLFGAGKGDQRARFNSFTNVGSAEVEVSGGLIYGSIFGGSEDGHVLGDTKVTVKPGAWIGTTGTSYVEGNVFGGGRGFNGDVSTTGAVGGDVTVDIKGGTMLGSIYGGGRLASVGIDFEDSSNKNYGSFKVDDPATLGVDESDVGLVTVNISGGTIGNNLENKYYFSNVVTTGKTNEQIASERQTELQALKVAGMIPNTDFEYDEKRKMYMVKHTKGGNVFGGSMGRLTKLDDTRNDKWPLLAQVKNSVVNITGGTIKRNVFGGGEFGTVNQSTRVIVGGKWTAPSTITPEGSPVIFRDVYGGGYGSTDAVSSTITVWENHGTTADPDWEEVDYTFTPMQFAGCVGKSTNVNIEGGWVQQIVYGGGEMASVGVTAQGSTMNDDIDNEGASTEKIYGFGLSWPCQIGFVPGYEGTANVTVNGGRIGRTGSDYLGPVNASGKPIKMVAGEEVELTEDELDDAEEDNGDVFGGGKGRAGDRYAMAYLANVGSTVVNINLTGSDATPANYKDSHEVAGEVVYDHDCIPGSVYGGGENGHVINNTSVTLTDGLIGHAIYGGGKGKDTFKKTLNRWDTNEEYVADIYSVTSGKVYGNTSVTMNGGWVLRNIFGGGNMASVGKGNYSGGTDDYSTGGYGELPPRLNQALWSNLDFKNSGKTTVNILGGQVGWVNSTDPSKTVKDGLPYGNVFGGCRGEAAPNISETPRYHYSPGFFSGYVNETEVNIGTAGQVTDEDVGKSGKAPRIYGSVYGGGQDGHVRRDTHVKVYSGEIGYPFTLDNRENVMKTKTNSSVLADELDNVQWLHRGNVYGSGSGIGKYKFDFSGDGDTNDTHIAYGTNPRTGETNYVDEEDISNSAGSVTRFTRVDILGGKIHRNVYGGGSLASVGAPKIGQDHEPYKKGDTADGHGEGTQSMCTVNIAATVGSWTNYDESYGGEVYGASRGLIDPNGDDTYINFATTVWTQVNILRGADIKGNVFGGGDAGSVRMDTNVMIDDVPLTP